MTQDSGRLGPTLTMARLYESQQQFLDALAIYRRLHEERGDAEAAEKIGLLEQQILGEKSLHYSEVLRKAFSREELKSFRILPSERYQTWRNINDELNGAPDGPDPIAGKLDPPDPTPAPPVETISEEPPTPAPELQTAPANDNAEAGMLTIGGFIARLRQLGDDDTPLDEIPLGKLFEAIYGSRR